jgi:hypothetical protein
MCDWLFVAKGNGLIKLTIGGLEPGSDVIPIPKNTRCEFGYRLREVCMPGTPIVYNVWEREIKTLGYLVGSHNVFDVNLPGHQIIMAGLLHTAVITDKLTTTVITLQK